MFAFIPFSTLSTFIVALFWTILSLLKLFRPSTLAGSHYYLAVRSQIGLRCRFLRNLAGKEYCAPPASKQVAYPAGLPIDIHLAIILDTGCSQHIFRDKKMFTKLRLYSTDEVNRGDGISGIGSTIIRPHGVGTVQLSLFVGGQQRLLNLTNALYCPDIQCNLVSASQLMDLKCSFTLNHRNCSMNGPDETLVAQFFRQSGLLFFHTWHDQQFGLVAYSTSSNPARRLWHKRLGHLSKTNLEKLATISPGIDLNHDPDSGPESCACTACIRGRMKDVSHWRTLFDKDTKPFEVIFSDIKGPMTHSGYEGSKYFVTFIDAATKYSEVFMMKYRTEVPTCWRRFKAHKERRGYKILRLHSDGGGEYCSDTFQNELRDDGIQFTYSTPESQQQNGMAERLNQTLHSKAFPSMLDSAVPDNYWPEAVKHANWLRNRLPVNTLELDSREARTPYMLVHQKLTNDDISYVRVFGCDVWYRAGSQKKHRAFLDEKGQPGHFVGFDSRHIIRIRDKQTGRLVRATIVRFEENHSRTLSETDGYQPKRHFPAQDSESSESEDENERPTRFAHFQDTTVQGLRRSRRQEKKIAKAKATSRKIAKAMAPERWPDSPQRPQRIKHMPRRYVQPEDLRAQMAIPTAALDTTSKVAVSALLSHMTPTEPYEPTTLEQALTREDGLRWKVAADDEYNSLIENGTWTLVPPPTNGRKVLDAKWVFKYKRGDGTASIRHKARWVVKGFRQVYGLDYNDTFASVVKPMSYKTLFAIAAAQDYEIEQMDVKTAFLYGEIDEEIYLQQPIGFDDKSGRVCKLNKALYGLKQSPRIWYSALSTFLLEIGFKPLDSDQSVFTDGTTFIAVYVDDLLLIGPDEMKIAFLKIQLSAKFKMTDLGAASNYLGMEIQRDRPNRRLRINQRFYIEQGIRNFGLWDSPSPLTPMSSAPLVSAGGDYKASSEFKTRYQSAVGTLMYAMLGTRPDIAFAVSCVSRHAANPDGLHWKAVQRIFCYLLGTINMSLVYEGDIHNLRGFTDADYGGDLDTRRSTTGFVFDIGSGAISWSSKRQQTVSLSTCQAEYQAQTAGAKEAVWLRSLLHEILQPVDDEAPYATIIYGDNQGAIALAKDPKYHAKTKHIEIQHHWIREKVAGGEIELEYIHTSRQIADGLTKPLPKDTFCKFREAVGVRE